MRSIYLVIPPILLGRFGSNLLFGTSCHVSNTQPPSDSCHACTYYSIESADFWILHTIINPLCNVTSSKIIVYHFESLTFPFSLFLLTEVTGGSRGGGTGTESEICWPKCDFDPPFINRTWKQGFCLKREGSNHILASKFPTLARCPPPPSGSASVGSKLI